MEHQRLCIEGGFCDTYHLVTDIEQSADRIVKIFQNGAYEMINNSEIEWHQDRNEIIRRVGTGDWHFYACYAGDEMIAVESMYIIRGDRIMKWVWGCVDPKYRGVGVWQNIGIYTDMIVEKSGAQVGSVREALQQGEETPSKLGQHAPHLESGSPGQRRQENLGGAGSLILMQMQKSCRLGP